ncbi:MAG: hypothetical protein AAFY60_08180, partial [Myxococcota bacterium]
MFAPHSARCALLVALWVPACAFLGMERSVEVPASVLPEPYLAYPDGAFLLEDVRVIDGRGAAALEAVDLFVRDGRIEEIGPDLVTDDSVTRLKLNGHTVMPGLIHLHDHLAYMSSPFRGFEFMLLDPHPFSLPKLFLSAGVTTIRTAGSDSVVTDRELANMIRRGTAVGPRIMVTSHIVDGPYEGLLPVAVTEEDGREFVRSELPWGVSWVKVYSSLPPAALLGVIEE